MQTPKSSRHGGYSDFFFSGFRAFASRNTSRPVSMYSLPGISSGAKEDTDSKPSMLQRLPRHVNSRRQSLGSRRLSAIVLPSTNSSQKPPSDDITEKRRRRSSVFEFSTRLLEKVTPGSSNPSEAQSFVQFKGTKRKSLGYATQNTSTAAEVWITAGGPITRSRLASLSSTEPGARHPIDPFNASPESKSFYIELGDTPPMSPARSKRESFLSLSSSSRSSLPTRRERPTSIHSMPTPLPQSRRSSFQFKRLSRDKYDNAFTLEEEESPILPDGSHSLLVEHEELADIDWRQFHIELLDNVQY